MSGKKFYIASDHAGFPLKAFLLGHLPAGVVAEDLGPMTEDAVDYPDYVAKLAAKMAEDPIAMGILICGSGIGMSIAANRFAHLRAALCFDAAMARLARQHNNANVLVLAGRMIAEDEAAKTVAIFCETDFEGGRHERRLDKLSKLSC